MEEGPVLRTCIGTSCVIASGVLAQVAQMLVPMLITISGHAGCQAQA